MTKALAFASACVACSFSFIEPNKNIPVTKQFRTKKLLMYKSLAIILSFFIGPLTFAQTEKKENAPIKQVTVFKNGAQVQHEKSVNISSGKQFIVFEKITEFTDPSSLQLKCSENATILSVRVRKNYDENSVKEADLKTMTANRKALEDKKQALEDEYHVLLTDEKLIQDNSRLWSNQSGVKTAELKEAVAFNHAKLMEIGQRKSQLQKEIEDYAKKINVIDQEINTRSSLPVTIYSEVVVELSADRSGQADFTFSYITPNAFWTPYYDMRSAGINSPISLEAKGLVSQNTGIEWKNVKLILSTNDPYESTQEPNIEPWYLDYYSSLPRPTPTYKSAGTYTYFGETIHGEVLDISTGEPLAFAKISIGGNAMNFVTTDASGKFSFQVPRNTYNFSVEYLGYYNQSISINSPYYKIAMIPVEIAMETVNDLKQTWAGSTSANGDAYYAAEPAPEYYSYDYEKNATLEEVQIVSAKKNKLRKEHDKAEYSNAYGVASGNTYATTVATQVVKDLRMEFVIDVPFTIPSDNADHRVPIAVYQMPATYEYHSVPKFDQGVFLVAQISGWEKLNLLSGESNIYFDGTYIGKSFVDVNSTKDTISFSFGKDNKIKVERKKSQEMSKTRLVGSRYKYEVTWDFTIRNNGGANIPIIIKDHFPISRNSEIKVKEGTYEGASYDENTHILTWKFTTKTGEIKTFKFDYTVEYENGQAVYLE